MVRKTGNHPDGPDKDRRRFHRFTFGCPVGLFTPAIGRWRKELAQSRTNDISNGGCHATP